MTHPTTQAEALAKNIVTEAMDNAHAFDPGEVVVPYGEAMRALAALSRPAVEDWRELLDALEPKSTWGETERTQLAYETGFHHAIEAIRTALPTPPQQKD